MKGTVHIIGEEQRPRLKADEKKRNNSQAKLPVKSPKPVSRG